MGYFSLGLPALEDHPVKVGLGDEGCLLSSAHRVDDLHTMDPILIEPCNHVVGIPDLEYSAYIGQAEGEALAVVGHVNPPLPVMLQLYHRSGKRLFHKKFYPGVIKRSTAVSRVSPAPLPPIVPITMLFLCCSCAVQQEGSHRQQRGMLKIHRNLAELPAGGSAFFRGYYVDQDQD